MGDVYEYGCLNCFKDLVFSVYFYIGVVERGYVVVMMGLCVWYMVGVFLIFEKDEEEVYEWVCRFVEFGEWN